MPKRRRKSMQLSRPERHKMILPSSSRSKKRRSSLSRPKQRCPSRYLHRLLFVACLQFDNSRSTMPGQERVHSYRDRCWHKQGVYTRRVRCCAADSRHTSFTASPQCRRSFKYRLNSTRSRPVRRARF